MRRTRGLLVMLGKLLVSERVRGWMRECEREW